MVTLGCLTRPSPQVVAGGIIFLLQETPTGVESQDEVLGRNVLVRIALEDPVSCGVEDVIFRDAVFEC